MADYYFKMDDMAVGYQGKTLIHDINIGIDKHIDCLMYFSTHLFLIYFRWFVCWRR